MLSRGYVSDSSLHRALEAQRANGYGRIGYWLERLGSVTEAQITAALGMQWACPVLPAAFARDSLCTTMLPFRLLLKFRMLPVRFMAGTRILYMAFSQGVDYPALHAIEGILGCRTAACLLGQTAMDRILEGIARERHPDELHFEHTSDPAEIAAIVCRYVSQIGARAVRTAVCGEYIWMRLESGPSHVHLLFRRPNSGDDELEARFADHSSTPTRPANPAPA